MFVGEMSNTSKGGWARGLGVMSDSREIRRE